MSICKNMNIYSNESEEIYLVSTEKKMKNIFSVLKMIKDETSSREYIFTEISNKMMHILNGNINSIVITTWNKGNKQAIDSMERIKAIIHENKSDVIFINEFNFYKNQDKSLIKIDGYNIELDQIYVRKGIARSAMYIKDTLKYKLKENMKLKIILQL